MLKNALANGMDISEFKESKNQILNLTNENKRLKDENVKLVSENEENKKLILRLQEQIKILRQGEKNTKELKNFNFTFQADRTSKYDSEGQKLNLNQIIE